MFPILKLSLQIRPGYIQRTDCKLITEVSGMCVKQWKAFPAFSVIWVSFLLIIYFKP